MAHDAFERMSVDFDRMHLKVGRASVPPERLLKAPLFTSLYSIRSERAFWQELDYNLLYRWFLDIDLMELSFDTPVFATAWKEAVRGGDVRGGPPGLMSDERFNEDGR